MFASELRAHVKEHSDSKYAGIRYVQRKERGRRRRRRRRREGERRGEKGREG